VTTCSQLQSDNGNSTESIAKKNGAITLSGVNFSGYVGHVTDYTCSLRECLLLHAV